MKSSHSGTARHPLTSVGALALCALTLAATHVESGRAGSGTRWGADYFPNVTLTTHEGKTVRFFDDLVKGKIVAIDLIYTTCQYACPLETARLAQVQGLIGDRMGRDVFFYSITIDPDHDTPRVLAEYARKYGAGPGWLFLTGSQADIDLLSRKLGLYAPPDPNNPDGHLPYLLVGNQTTGQWMRNSAVDNPRFLARTIGDWLNGWQAAERIAPAASAESPALPFNTGQYTFGYHCAACHTLGAGTRIGPDLAGVTSRRERDWLRRFIAAPDRMNATGDPIAIALRAEYGKVRMPNLDLSDDDVDAVIDYLETRTREVDRVGAASERPALAAPPPAAEPLRAVLDAYLRLHQALYADTIGSIRSDAQAIETGAAALGAPGEPLRLAADALREIGDLDRARAAFGVLSDRVIALVRSSSSRPPGIVVAFCPMAQKYWLQRGERIQNPFYGTRMPECGRIATP
ncbi:MAG TPA: SCO family protein [Vicinamibacterales bacterium]|nr:SCO family protein [Vicinamibacterales bacterium]